MLQEVKDIQNDAVTELLSITNEKDNIVFKAPTGSGKTYMMADFMNRVLSTDNDVIFLVSTLSKGGLAKQNYNSFVNLSNSNQFNNLNSYLINSNSVEEERLFIPTDYNVYVLPRDLYKETSRLNRGGLIGFLNQITQTLNKKIYLIKDECHQATKNLDNISDYFDKTINFSATPNLSRGQVPDVCISEADAVNAHLIKKVEYQEYDGYDEENNLDKALDKYEEIKEKYNNELGINPCIIIQISNKDLAEEEWSMIKRVLGNTKHQDLKWMLIVNKNNKESSLNCETNDIIGQSNASIEKWKDYAKNNEATINAIIFKMVISEGWDIPRACMLYQIRDTQSKQLDEQVIGRVRRNPRLLDFERLTEKQQNLLSKAYVWGINDNIQSKSINVNLGQESEQIRNSIRIKTTILENLINVGTIDIDEICNSTEQRLTRKSIFDLYREFIKSNNEVHRAYESYVDRAEAFYSFTNSIHNIKLKIREQLCDYEQNMVVKNTDMTDSTISLPRESYFTETEHYLNIDDWIWYRTDGSSDFSFDSLAEKEWAEVLLSIRSKNNPQRTGRLTKDIIDENDDSIYLWGKNFLGNSEIRFEYYLDGTHFSYPDFILQDYKDRIHLFEVKSANKSNNLNINASEYTDKVEALKECYKHASRLTQQHFWIPIKSNATWQLHHYYNGEHELLSKEEFINRLKD